MGGLDFPALLWILVGIQLLGLLTAWLTRITEGSWCQSWCQWAFFACLGLVGVATVVSIGLGPGCWLPSGATLSSMVLAAICDFSDASRVVF